MGVVTLDDLRVFIAVYETGNLSAVARTLRCTQSAVSQHIKRLETRFIGGFMSTADARAPVDFAGGPRDLTPGRPAGQTRVYGPPWRVLPSQEMSI